MVISKTCGGNPFSMGSRSEKLRPLNSADTGSIKESDNSMMSEMLHAVNETRCHLMGLLAGERDVLLVLRINSCCCFRRNRLCSRQLSRPMDNGNADAFSLVVTTAGEKWRYQLTHVPVCWPAGNRRCRLQLDGTCIVAIPLCRELSRSILPAGQKRRARFFSPDVSLSIDGLDRICATLGHLRQRRPQQEDLEQSSLRMAPTRFSLNPSKVSDQIPWMLLCKVAVVA
jgi:hypothetical protein